MENCLIQLKNILFESGKKKIAVVGKGDSIDKLSQGVLQDYFVINLNDSEYSVKGDLTLFHRADYYLKLKEVGFSQQYYLAPDFYKIPAKKHVETEYKTTSQENVEAIYQYFADSNFYLTDYLILSAIKLVAEVNKIAEIHYPVYFIGFDFFSKEVKEGDFKYHDNAYRNVVLKTQESLFKMVVLNPSDFNLDLDIYHIGDKSYSTLSIDSFNQIGENKLFKTSSTNKQSNSELYHQLLKRVEDSNKVIVVAEFTNNHIGDKNRLVEMIGRAKEAGADMIKLQKRDVKSFYTPEELNKPYRSPFGNTLGAYRKGVELTKELFEIVNDECTRLEIPWFTSVLDWASYQFMLQFDTPILKLPSTISNHKNYLTKVASDFKGDVVVSTGFTDKTYEDFVIEHFSKGRNLFLLQCTSSYPTPPEACQIAVVRHYSGIADNNIGRIFPGYSSHDVGSLGCMLSVAAGAKMIEKHVKLGDLEWIHFDGVALDLQKNEFKDFIFDIRQAELMCGQKKKVIHKQEHHKYKPNLVHN